MKIDKVTGYIGANISGVDLATCNDQRIYDEIRTALNEHGVIFFRDQKLTVEQYVAFGERFGTLFINRGPTIQALADYPPVEELRKEPDERSNIGDEWHSDQAHRQNPCMGTILYGKLIPPYGGDTLFASPAAAYEHLPAQLREEIEGLEAVNSQSFLIRETAMRTGDPDGRFARAAHASAEAIHPVVKVHPETGRKVIFVNPAYTYSFVGKSREESLPLLNELFKRVLLPEFGCRFSWREGSLAFWDNRQTWHYAVNDYQGHRRIMHRLVVQSNPRGA